MTNMAGNEGDDLASLEAKTINQGAVVELIRRRYSHDQIYVRKIPLCKSLFVSCGLNPLSRSVHCHFADVARIIVCVILLVKLVLICTFADGRR